MMRTVTVIIESKYVNHLYVFYSQFATICWNAAFLHTVLELRILCILTSFLLQFFFYWIINTNFADGLLYTSRQLLCLDLSLLEVHAFTSYPTCALQVQLPVEKGPVAHRHRREKNYEKEQRADLLQAHVQADCTFQCRHLILGITFPHDACIACFTSGYAA